MGALLYPERVKGGFWEEASPEEHLEGGTDGLHVEKRKKGFLVDGTVKKIHLRCLNRPVCGILLWQPQKIGTQV